LKIFPFVETRKKLFNMRVVGRETIPRYSISRRLDLSSLSHFTTCDEEFKSRLHGPMFLGNICAAF
jgi:hypothetical protein